MAPIYGLVLVMALWVISAVVVWRLGRSRPGWALVVPFAALGLWFAIMWMGDTWLNWTA
jgi:hypothetical protein